MQIIENINEINNIENKLIAIRIYADWCNLCKKMLPRILTLEKEFSDVKFISVEIGQVPEIVKYFNVGSLPMFVLLKDGTEVERINGMALIGPMRKVFRELLAS